MKIAIIGCNGFVGKSLINVLLKMSVDIIAIDRIICDTISNHRLKYIQFDFSLGVYEFVKENDIDYVINLASDTNVQKSIDNPVDVCLNNFNMQLYLLESFRLNTCLKNFIQVSTSEVYGPALENYSHIEWSPVLPSNPYAASKAAQEALCISYWRTYNFPLTIVNTMNIFGQGEPDNKIIPLLVKSISEQSEITLHGNKKQIATRKYTYVYNLCDAIVFLMQNKFPVVYSENNIYPDRYNVVGDNEYTSIELGNEIAKYLGKKFIYKLQDFHSTRPGHDRRYALDGRKINEEGWKELIGFKTALQNTVDWELKRLGI